MTGNDIPRDEAGRVRRPKPSQLLADVMEALGPDHLTTRTLMAALIERDQGAGVEPRAVSPVYGWHIPVLSDPPNVPYDMQENSLDIEATMRSTFASAAERDAAIPNPVEGRRCHRLDLKRDEVYSGTAWRGDLAIAAPASPTAATRNGFGLYTAGITTDANGDTQTLDLTAGGQFAGGAGSLLWAGAMRFGATIGYQLAPVTNDVSAAKFRVWNQAGVLVASASPPNFFIAYLARLAY